MIRCLQLALVLIALWCEGARSVEVAHVETDADVVSRVSYASVRCGGRFVLDSLHPNMPSGGSYASPYLPFYPEVMGAAGAAFVSYALRKVEASFARRVEDTLHVGIPGLLLVEVDSAALPAGDLCNITWDPRAVFSGSVMSSVTVAVLEASGCADGVASVAFAPGGRAVVRAATESSEVRASAAVTVLSRRDTGPGATYDLDDAFPAAVQTPGGCRMTLALVVSAHGRYTDLRRWLPLVVYSAFFVPLVLIGGRRRVHAQGPLGTALLALAFVGFTGCCTGVGVELALWSYPLHPFPFPGSVTLFLCCAVGYAVLLAWLLWGHPLGSVATSALLSMLLYGVACGLAVGYFMRAFLVIGVLAVGMIGVHNFAALVLAARFSAKLPHSFREHAGSNAMLTALAWCPLTAPIVPVTFLAQQLAWSASADGEPPHHSRLAVVRLHAVCAGVLFALLHSTSTMALLLAACVYHTPFVVALFPVLLVVLLHAAFILQEYSRAWRFWGRGGLWLSVDRAVAAFAVQQRQTSQPRTFSSLHTPRHYADSKAIEAGPSPTPAPAPASWRVPSDSPDTPRYDYGGSLGGAHPSGGSQRPLARTTFRTLGSAAQAPMEAVPAPGRTAAFTDYSSQHPHPTSTGGGGGGASRSASVADIIRAREGAFLQHLRSQSTTA